QETIEQRGRAERALAERAERRDALARRAYEARSAGERLALRAEQVAGAAQRLTARIVRLDAELSGLGEHAGPADDADGDAGAERVAALEAELATIEATRERDIERETEDLLKARDGQAAQLQQSDTQLAAARASRERSDAEAAEARLQLA